MADSIEALRARISGLEREISRINVYASAAMSERMRMEAWFLRERPGMIGHSETILDLVRVEQAALAEFAYVSRQLANARGELDRLCSASI